MNEGHLSSEANICNFPDLNGNHDDTEGADGCADQSTFGESASAEHIEVQYSIIEELEKRLAVGQTVKSVEDAYFLYCSYAHAKGFSVKRGDQCYFPHTKEIQSKDFQCSCEGAKDEKRSVNRKPVYQKPITRTKCKARLKVGREKGGEWKVTKFFMEHNHEMVAGDQTHLLRSSRNISHAHKLTLEAMVNAGIPPATAFSFFGRGSTWATKFRDYQCMIDYEYFGDVVSVDTTYRTNRYNLICAPFVGINHHKQNVMFGLAFMSDETENSFEWLFSTFLDSMNGKQPETIFTDQCQAMMNAVGTIFPCAHHRLCQWHVNQNAPSHFGSLNGDSRFKQLWHECMSRCESEEEFEAKWKIMIDKYNLSNHKWLSGMYKLRHKWATAFSNDKINEVVIRNPVSVKSRGVTNARIRGHWDDKSKKVTAKGTKRKEQSSQGANCVPISQGVTNIQSSQYMSGYPCQVDVNRPRQSVQFPSQVDANRPSQSAPFPPQVDVNRPYWPLPMPFPIMTCDVECSKSLFAAVIFVPLVKN
ncbi:hypothetical protein BUALT_Bualt05G0012400 [Buddleja alternifolia]|uniref:Protein FAR1-RELATED SEQUENCE n=1 Tax=Buddleja alternifolia TaxID=168488 RepID=A0AAV6XRT5_9LAMI|nr:hypothetical protein BUALT_Bualt05G0012400 [Buddleja alternifolia]